MNANVKKIVLWSSSSVYREADPKFYEILIKEDVKLNPKCEGRYDISKREQETAALKYYKENGFPLSVMRPSPIYGLGSYYGIYALFKSIHQHILSECPQNFHKRSIPLVHVKDIAGSAEFLSDEKKFNGEIYNISDDNDLDLIQTCKFIANNTDSKLKVIVPIPIILWKIIKLLFKKLLRYFLYFFPLPLS